MEEINQSELSGLNDIEFNTLISNTNDLNIFISNQDNLNLLTPEQLYIINNL